MKASEVKVGMKVVVTRKVRSRSGGWNNSWETEMDSWVGKTCIVMSCAGQDIHLRRPGAAMTFGFPARVLEPAKKKGRL